MFIEHLLYTRSYAMKKADLSLGGYSLVEEADVK